MNKVGIIGIGLNLIKGEQRPQFYELNFLAAKNALDSIGLTNKDIDIFIESECDLFDGRLISNMYTCGAIGAYLKDESRVSEDGLLGLAYAYMKIKSGEYDIALVSSSSSNEVDYINASTTVLDPFIYRPLSMNYLSGLAFQAASYKLKFKINDEYPANIVKKNRKYGSENPRAYLKSEVSIDDILKSDYIVWPLRELMVSPIAIGSVAVILASEHIAKRYSDNPIWIDSVAWYTDGYYLNGSTKSLYYLSPLIQAAKKIYSKLDIEKPQRQIDLFEVSDATAYHELMIYEALQLAPLGMGQKLIENEDLKVNVSGGTLSTNLFLASGLFKVAEAYLQLRGEAGPIQINGVKRALVHGFTYVGGASSQTHTVMILSNN